MGVCSTRRWRQVRWLALAFFQELLDENPCPTFLFKVLCQFHSHSSKNAARHPNRLLLQPHPTFPEDNHRSTLQQRPNIPPADPPISDQQPGTRRISEVPKPLARYHSKRSRCRITSASASLPEPGSTLETLEKAKCTLMLSSDLRLLLYRLAPRPDDGLRL